MSDMILFGGNATPELTKNIAKYLNATLGNAKVGRFSDGEVAIEILENVRGMDVFIIQSTCNPTNDNLMELVIMADALRRASAKRITAVVPYFGYSRQDRRVRSARVPISAKVVADMMATVGIDRVLTVDLHADQIQGFFDIPVDNVYATPVLIDHMQKNSTGDEIVVSPDVGGVVRARAVAKRLNDSELAIIDKRRPEANKSEVMHIIGDVNNRDCLILDDMVDTAGTLCTAAKALKDSGAKTVSAYATHPVLSGKAIENINNSVLDKLVVTDTIPLSEEAKQCNRIQVLSLSELLGESIRRVNEEESISTMFLD
ncbi:MAG: ribose-phosphate pyrophosphokinase [Gammaproteobacteria bacterium]|nr:ribose-phosphate pyrophosphokinase [Gammaproteobacteria bacterium]MDH5630646.1 ribose-phosphate pyrophosphokinase [Gammaproteobacteria bacterium]